MAILTPVRSKKAPEDIHHPMKSLDQRDAYGDKQGAHEQRADNPPKQDRVLY